jgi:SAM-dependent methyltransferase
MPFYDSFALAKPSAIGEWMDKAFSNAALSLLEEHVMPSSVLEIGPGRGLFADVCQKKDIAYTCLDISSTLLQKINVKNRVNALAQFLPFSENSFDAVFAANVLEHMQGFREAVQFIENMKRVVRPNGVVAVRVPNVMAWKMHFWNGDYTHGFPTTPRNVSQIFFDLDLDIVDLRAVSGPVIGRNAYLLSLFSSIIPSGLFNHGARLHNSFDKRVYSLKTSLLLGFIIVGKKR